jgi:hypothetical protein
VADPAAELTDIVRQLYRLMARHRQGIALVQRSVLDWPELAVLWFGRLRGRLIDQLAQYLALRIAHGLLRPAPDPTAAARLIVEVCAFFAMHRHGDPFPTPMDEATGDDRRRRPGHACHVAWRRAIRGRRVACTARQRPIRRVSPATTWPCRAWTSPDDAPTDRRHTGEADQQTPRHRQRNQRRTVLRAGAHQATLVDAAIAYTDVAQAEAVRLGHADRLDARHGDFVALADDLVPADLVTLDRVICCYPDMPALVGRSAALARRAYGLVYPRDGWWVRPTLALVNLAYRLRRRSFRVFAHPSAAVDAVCAARSRPRTRSTTLVWQVVVTPDREAEYTEEKAPMDHARPLPPTARPHQAPRRLVAGGLGFDALMTLLGSWVVGGLFLDGWAHTHGQVDATFFTPWHGLLYAGLAAVFGVLGATLAVNRRAGSAWRRALPAGYGWSLVGALLFGAAGLADLVWHTLFGFEANFEALASPPHLLLVAGVWLIVGGPLRAAWQRPATPRTWPEQLPAVLSLTFLLSLLTFFTAQAQPIPNPGFWGGPAPSRTGNAGLLQEMGMTSLLLSTAALSGMLLFLLGRWQPRPGALTLILTLNGVAMTRSSSATSGGEHAGGSDNGRRAGRRSVAVVAAPSLAHRSLRLRPARCVSSGAVLRRCI